MTTESAGVGFDDSSTFKFVGILIAIGIGVMFLYESGYISASIVNSLTTVAFWLVAVWCIAVLAYFALVLLHSSVIGGENDA